MKRPHLSKPTAELEKLFQEQRDDLGLLNELAIELRFRSTPRAKRLLESVFSAQQAAMAAKRSMSAATGTDGVASNVVKGNFSPASAGAVVERVRVVEAAMPVEQRKETPRDEAPLNDEEARLADNFKALRKRLLDLTLKNPMLNYRPQARSRRHIQIVDESLEDVFNRLSSDELQLDIAPLPEPPDIPPEEKTEEFVSQLAYLKSTDLEYQIEMKALLDEARDSEFEIAKIERRLRDRLRKEMGLPPVPSRKELDLNDHATQNKINPAIDLDKNGPKSGARRLRLQTMMLSENLLARMGTIRDIARLSEQEMGFSTLFTAFGFLEWYEKEDSEKALFAPLILLPVKLAYKTDAGKKTYSVKATSEAANHNVTLKKRLEELHRVLPEFDSDSESKNPVALYFEQVRSAIAGLPRWRIRSFVILGHFAFGRLAMYQDLDPEQWATPPHRHALVGPLLRGAQTVVNGDGDALPNAPEDYEIDAPEVASKAPLLIHDADASQHSAIIDVMKRQNLVISGPPGTGKSQTIANIIVNVLAANPTATVLFLSEKRAALEVVKRRLDTAGVGEFGLELHSEKSAPSEVIKSVKDRLNGRPKARPANPMSRDAWESARKKLSGYLTELHARDEDEQTAFDLFWRSVAANGENIDVPKDVLRATVPESLFADPEAQRRLCATMDLFGALADEFARGHGPRAASPWARFSLRSRPGQAEDLLVGLRGLQEAIANADAAARQAAAHDLPDGDLEQLRAIMRLPAPPNLDGIDLIARVDPDEAAQALGLLQSLRQIEAELAANAVSVDVTQTDLDAAVRLAENVWDQTLLAMTPAEVLDRAEEMARRASRMMGQINLTRSLRELLRMRDSAPIAALPAACAAAVLAALVPDAFRTWLQWKPIGSEEDFAQARDRWLALSQSDEDWKEKLNGYDPSARPPSANLHAAADVLSEGHVGLKPWRHTALKEAKALAAGLGLQSSTAAASTLVDFADHLDDLANFEADDRAKNAIGPLWNGMQTAFAEMGAALKMRVTISKRLAAYEHGAEIAETLLELDDQAIAELSQQKDTARAVLSAPAEDRIDFAALSIGQAYDAAGTIAHRAQAALAAVAPDTVAHLELSLATLQRRARRTAERDALSAQIATLPTGAVVAPLVRVPEDAGKVASVLQWTKQIRDSGAPEALTQRLLTADAAKVYEASIALADRAAMLLEAVAAARDVVVEKCGIGLHGVPQAELADWLSAAIDHRAELREFLTLEDTRRGLEQDGLHGFLEAVEASSIPPKRYADVLDYVFLRRRAERLYRSRANLSDASGIALDAQRRLFADHDKRKIAHDRATAHTAIFARTAPTGSNADASRKRWTEMALLRHEMDKERGFLNVRALLRQAGRSLQSLKPCFMMSPMSVAKFLPKQMTFDVVIIDEASQMRPEDALGALLRTRQIVVVGDAKQLPPTDFFDRAMDGDNDDDDGDEIDDVTDESILESCAKSFDSVRDLKWHYRSRCESLIAFSNEQFYSRSLITFPMARPGSFSIDRVYVAGDYQANQNPAEAQRICEDAIALMGKLVEAEESEFGTIGVVAVNSKQSELINSEFERLSAGNAAVELYMEKCEALGEPFFVKNLENVQGDERDFILISLTYGRAPGAKSVAQRFGPINRSQGHRRLNVLFTRARRRIGLFTSMLASDIRSPEVDRPSGVGVLKAYLEYAERGPTATGVPNRGEFDSDFERQVAERLERHGFDVDIQVGVSKFRIDLGVKHRKHPSVYVAGVECDGASYHSSRSARDRDRLREEVLRGLGWNIVRIWSTDWFANADDAAARLVREIERLESLPVRNQDEIVFGRGDANALSMSTEPAEEAEINDEIAPEAKQSSPPAQPSSLLTGTRPLTREETRRALEELRRVVIDVETPAESHRNILREAMIEHFIGVRFSDPDEWMPRVPTHLRSGCDPAHKKYLGQICDVINRMHEGPLN
jgi:very-short-patch-repair endonuclease/DNA polymerase III delta prime subunit